MRLTMQPMKITAYLLDGRIAGTEPYFPLDSILAPTGSAGSTRRAIMNRRPLA